MNRSYYSAAIESFLQSSMEEVLGKLFAQSEFGSESRQKDAWIEEIRILQLVLRGQEGSIYFEFSIPRMGRRADVVLIIKSVLFVLEFKVGEEHFTTDAIDQVVDYALDLKNFHETSHGLVIAPILIATQASESYLSPQFTPHNDKVFVPLKCSSHSLPQAIANVLKFASDERIDPSTWEAGRYRPTPTIIEAARALYNNHSVDDIARNDANENLAITSLAISKVIDESKQRRKKSLCFITGVPGAGKTLVGLNIATAHGKDSSAPVFLSGNGPLVAILQRALALDKIASEKRHGRRIRLKEALSEVKSFIQNVHHFRDEYLIDQSPPNEHVTLFDEAQRAWTLSKTADFMKREKKRPGFAMSEPEFLISCLDRHKDWAVIVCLVGGGQEINTGEAGISEWLESLIRSYPEWQIHISPNLTDSEYRAQEVLQRVTPKTRLSFNEDLHLRVSMRSFRAENVSLLVKQILDLEEERARQTLSHVSTNYPIAITRDLHTAKSWLREKARGSERYGIVVSSEAQRLKPHAIDVKSPMDPVHWFLDGKEDVRSSFYLEDVATEFDVQGLELDWACVTWDADFRYSSGGWGHHSFVGDRWNNIKRPERQLYQKNAYRVLLTRARQGMVIVVPKGDSSDPTRRSEYYDPTFNYLKRVGFDTI